MAPYGHIAAAPLTPLLETLAEARREVDARLSEDEYTLARIIGSEHFSGSPMELLCIGDADCNKASDQGLSITAHATRGNGYGPQGEGNPKRPVSTTRPPAPRHVLAALALLRGFNFWGIPLPWSGAPARGISKGARRYWDPKAQRDLNRQHGPAKYCKPLTHLERWCFGRDVVSREGGDCQLGGPRRPVEEWCGPIVGVNPWVLMLMRPASIMHAFNYSEARRIIETEGRYRGAPIDPGGPLVALTLFMGAAAFVARLKGIA